MPITRLNHAVLYVQDAERSADFYSDVLGFRTVMAFPGAAFLQAPGSTNDHDLGLFSAGPQAAPAPRGGEGLGLYHLAWEVDTLDELDRYRTVLMERGALVGETDHVTTKALYAKDPDGIEFEVSWLVPAELLDDETVAAARAGRARRLDLASEKARYGATTKGGLGVSTPA